MSESGWIKLHRKLLENPVWNRKPFSYGQAWVTMLLECNHKDVDILIETEVIKCKRGQSVKSLKTWSNLFGWSIRNTRTFFKLLQDLSMIRTEGLRKSTRITVCNYDRYQNDRQADDTQVTSRRHTGDTQVTTNKKNKNVENDKNEKKKDKYGDFVFLFPDEYEKLISEFGKQETDRAIYHLDNYIPNRPGKAYKDHYRVLRGWPIEKVKQEGKSSGYKSNVDRAEEAAIAQRKYFERAFGSNSSNNKPS